jgi:DNA (cytosine-5)-methyltransferase 1
MRFLDFFSGIGGFRLGMEMAEHKCLGHCEIDKFADKSYRAMHDVKEDEWYADDVRRVRADELPDADCWCGGFPCQAFSIAGKRAGFEDMRGTLIFEIFRLAAERKPKVLFLENVAGLLNHDGGRTFATILTGLWELGYDVQWQVLNSKDFGVPQNRERVFIVGYIRGTSIGKVFPITKNDRQTNDIQRQQSVANCLTARYEGAQATGTYVIECEQHAQIKCIGNIMPNGNKNNSVPGRVYDISGLSPCLRTPTGGNVMPLALTNKRIRRLTPKECFRLQGFPDEYFERAAKVNSDSQLYKQAGNSVTVNVIYEIAKRLVIV